MTLHARITAVTVCYLATLNFYQSLSKAQAFPQETATSDRNSVMMDGNGFRIHIVPSSYQSGPTKIRVLLPDTYDRNRNYQVLYVLAVVVEDKRRFGDGLSEVKKHGFHNRFDLICVAPEFTNLPWYADHADAPSRRDESHFTKVVVPFIDQTYSTRTEADGRLLVGFSKSGWGAFTLILRHPHLFGKAAGWDTGIRIDMGPMSEEERAQRIEQIFGSRETFEEYRLSNLVKKQVKTQEAETRLFYYSTGGPREIGGAELHRLMLEMGVPHRYLFEPKRKHRWDSGWLPEAVRFLVEDVSDSR